MSNENYSLIGIYGGTFDSIHYGHLRLAEELNELLVLSKLVFIPSGSPRLRNAPVASKHHRAAMLSLAIQNNETFMLDDREMWRDGESYSVVTLREFREEVGSECALCFIMGCDAFLDKDVRIQSCEQMTPSGQVTTPEDVGELVAFMMTSKSAVQLQGQTIVIDGGKTLLS